MKKVLLACIASLAFMPGAFPLDFALRVTPNMTFPSEENIGKGMGGMANIDLDLFNFITLGIEGGYASAKQESLDKNYNIFIG